MTAAVHRKGDFRYGSWLCENAKTLHRDRRSYSSKTVLVAQQASGFNLEIELKNIILRRVSIFEFLHSQGQTEKSGCSTGRSASPRIADIPRNHRHVSKVLPKTDTGSEDINLVTVSGASHAADISS